MDNQFTRNPKEKKTRGNTFNAIYKLNAKSNQSNSDSKDFNTSLSDSHHFEHFTTCFFLSNFKKLLQFTLKWILSN